MDSPEEEFEDFVRDALSLHMACFLVKVRQSSQFLPSKTWTWFLLWHSNSYTYIWT